MYRCEHALSAALCIALLPFAVWDELRAKQTELAIAQRSCIRYCPNVSCRALMHISAICECREADERPTRRSFNAVCRECRYHFCAHCRRAAHWPADCDAAAAFELLLVKRRDDAADSLVKIEYVYVARVKRCPNCREPIEKKSGCNHMVCRYSFAVLRLFGHRIECTSS